MTNLHIIIYSPFPDYSGGRENWLHNIIPRLEEHFKAIYIYSFASDTPTVYSFQQEEKISINKIKTLRTRHILFSVLNRLTFRIPFILDALIVYPHRLKKIISQKFNKGDIFLALNSVIELKPLIEMKKKSGLFHVICSVRGDVPTELTTQFPLMKNWWQKSEKNLLSQADLTLSNGFDTHERLRSIGIRSIVMPNGVNYDRFSRLIKSNDDSGSVLHEIKKRGQPIVMMVATLRKIKGIEDMLRMIPYLKSEISRSAKFVFVGKGNQMPYKALASRLGVEDRVVFLGEQKNIPFMLSLADVVVCTSGGGGMSMAALEAMAAGKAIVAWNSQIYQQLITHMHSGFLAEDENLEELANGVDLLLTDRSLATRLGKNAQSSSKQYDWEIIADKLLSLLINHNE
ncbi:MAG TPA: glycosyltransferase family 4 protein [Bellilinea sp.]|nr:glycosyltransferase family 4 protein [Bellilinea sp.]